MDEVYEEYAVGDVGAAVLYGNGRPREIRGKDGTLPTHCPESHPKQNRKAAHTSFIRAGLSWATRFPNRCWDTVTAWCRFTAQGVFMPSSWFNTISEGTPRMVEVTGATVTVDK